MITVHVHTYMYVHTYIHLCACDASETSDDYMMYVCSQERTRGLVYMCICIHKCYYDEYDEIDESMIRAQTNFSPRAKLLIIISIIFLSPRSLAPLPFLCTHA